MTVPQTQHLVLGPSSPGDCADFIALEQDPEVMRFLNGGFAVDRRTADPEASFLMPTGTEPHVWTARRRDTGAFVGWFCLWPESETQAELGYRLCRAAWGRGLASEGGAALVDWGFSTVGYETIVATTMTINHASRRVMEKIGMRHVRTVAFEGRDSIPGSEEGEVWYELTHAQWRRD